MTKIWILHPAKNVEKYENKKLLEHLVSAGYDAEIMEPDGFDIIVSRSGPRSIRYKGNVVELPSLVLSRTGSGTTYFGLTLMRQLESFGIPVINGSRSVGLVADKLETSQVLAKENLPMPKTILVKEKTDVGLIQKEVGFPCVVKATTGSHGNTVHLCEKKKDFNSLMGFLDAVSLKKTLIIQEFVDFAAGSDLRVWVIGGKTICAMKRTGPSGDFRANISAGGTGESYEVTPEIDFLAKETARVLGLEIAGVDLLFGSSGLLICEANSNPGFEGIDQYCNVDMAKHIVEYLQTKISP